MSAKSALLVIISFMILLSVVMYLLIGVGGVIFSVAAVAICTCIEAEWSDWPMPWRRNG